MKGVGIYPKITKDYILENIPQEAIFEFYTKIPVIDDNFYGNSFCNPFREDKFPTCNYYYDANNRLRIRDFAGELLDRLYNMDAFDVVGHIYRLSPSIPQHFKIIQHIIAKDFKINKYKDDEGEVIKITEFANNRKILAKRTKVIKVIPRKWNKADENYWYKRYGISSETLKLYRVIPIEEIYMEDENFNLYRIYTYKTNYPAYGYYGGKDIEIDIWKIYFPFAVKGKQHKILSNKQFEQGLEQFMPTKVGIVTKSLKDVMVLHEYNIQAVTLASESTPLTDDYYFWVNQLSGFIVSFLDFDYTGIKMAQYLKKNRNIQPLLLTRGRFGLPDYGAKDISDFRELYGKDVTVKLLHQTMDHLSDRFEDLENRKKQLDWLW